MCVCVLHVRMCVCHTVAQAEHSLELHTPYIAKIMG